VGAELCITKDATSAGAESASPAFSCAAADKAKQLTQKRAKEMRSIYLEVIVANIQQIAELAKVLSVFLLLLTRFFVQLLGKPEGGV